MILFVRFILLIGLREIREFYRCVLRPVMCRLWSNRRAMVFRKSFYRVGLWCLTDRYSGIHLIHYTIVYTENIGNIEKPQPRVSFAAIRRNSRSRWTYCFRQYRRRVSHEIARPLRLSWHAILLEIPYNLQPVLSSRHRFDMYIGTAGFSEVLYRFNNTLRCFVSISFRGN